MKNDTPSAAEFGRIISFMSRKGMTAQAARGVIGNGPNGRTRAEIADELKAWLKQLPKAS